MLIINLHSGLDNKQPSTRTILPFFFNKIWLSYLTIRPDSVKSTKKTICLKGRTYIFSCNLKHTNVQRAYTELWMHAHWRLLSTKEACDSNILFVSCVCVYHSFITNQNCRQNKLRHVSVLPTGKWMAHINHLERTFSLKFVIS